MVVVRLMFDLPLMDRTIMVHGKPVVLNAERNHLPQPLLVRNVPHRDGRIKRIEAVLRDEKLGRSRVRGESASGPPPP